MYECNMMQIKELECQVHELKISSLCELKTDEDLAPKDKAWIDDKTEQELEDLEDDLDDDRFLQEYRYICVCK